MELEKVKMIVISYLNMLINDEEKMFILKIS